MQIGFSAAAWRSWQKLPKEIQSRLETKLALYSRDPLRYAVKLTDSKIGQYRFRVGDYRIVFDISDDTIFVLAVGHRKDIYK